jgi:hypothetical protein
MSMNKEITSCMGYQQIVGAAASTALTIPQVDPVTGLTSMPVQALIICDGAGIRWRDDGVAPTASVGMPIAVGTVFVYDGDLTRLRIIQQAATATINVAYYK